MITSTTQKKIERELRFIERQVFQTRISQRVNDQQAREFIRERLIDQRDDNKFTDIDVLIEYLEDDRTIH